MVVAGWWRPGGRWPTRARIRLGPLTLCGLVTLCGVTLTRPAERLGQWRAAVWFCRRRGTVRLSQVQTPLPFGRGHAALRLG